MEPKTTQTSQTNSNTPIAIMVKKRGGKLVPFSRERVFNAIFAAVRAVGGSDRKEADRLTSLVVEKIEEDCKADAIDVELIQDTVEKILIEEGHAKTAKAYILYRQKRAEEREISDLQKIGTEESPLKDEILSKLNAMFTHDSKLKNIAGADLLNDYRTLALTLRKMLHTGELPVFNGDYLCGNELASNIFERKYYLKDIEGNPIEKRPEDVYARLASFIASIEPTEKKQLAWAKAFYQSLYSGYFIPGGRVIAGAGDLYRLKTLANCFVALIKKDNIESIYDAAYQCARTYSYGGGIGVDISVLRPKDAVVHNAADKSTGAVSFMELYSLTTGLIGQSGRRGALMLTIDVKHPDINDFIDVKKSPNWVTNQIVEQCKWSGKFDDQDLKEIQRQVMDNTQVRFANISIKVSDEFMQAVEEQTIYGTEKVLLYLKDKDVDNGPQVQSEENHFSYGMPARPCNKYGFVKAFDTTEELNEFLKETHRIDGVKEETFEDLNQRDIFGDIVIPGKHKDFAIRKSGDYMLYFNSVQTGEVKRLVKARDVWNGFVRGNYSTAEPGLIFWSKMTDYSPSNYVGRPISSTNPCGEVPLEDGGSCNLASLNLSRFVVGGYSDDAFIDFDELGRQTHNVVRFLDNVVSWNERLNALESQRDSSKLTRRLGLGVMGIADMLNQLGLGYDDEESIALMEKVMGFIADKAYEASAYLAEEKGTSPVFDYEKYKESPFFKESISAETQALIEAKGLRNIAILSIAPTGTISNIVLGYSERNGNEIKNYIGVSGGIEPIFALSYTRRSESFGNKFFRIFHSTVQAYLDKQGLTEKAAQVKDEEGLKEYLPAHFFRTAHHIVPRTRVRIQGVCQSYIDHSISSTVNLPEDIAPETISDIYLDAWRNGLKGITIYREGSRFPILKSDSVKNEFHNAKNEKMSVVGPDGVTYEGYGGDVVELTDGKLATIYHLSKLQKISNKTVSRTVEKEIGLASAKTEIPAAPEAEELAKTKTESTPEVSSTKEKTPSPKVDAKNEKQKDTDDDMQDNNLAVCPTCGKKTLKIDNGCNSCVDPECGFSKCDI